MKKLINSPDDVVKEELEGIAAAHGDRVRVSFDPAYIVRADAPVSGKVGIISGGGSGHEPMHGGFVGRGMLDAACPGEVFTSPTPDQMEAATKAVDGGAGVLHIVKNYTGDVLNFEMAAELASGGGHRGRSGRHRRRRRGQGQPLHRRSPRRRRDGAGREDLRRRRRAGQVAGRGRRALPAGQRRRCRSMGMALTPCITPGAGKPSFELGDDEMEIGIGIHGEPGRERRAARAGGEDRRAAGRRRSSRTCPSRDGRQGARVRQRHGRHAADRALHRLQRAQQAPAGPGHHHRRGT